MALADPSKQLTRIRLRSLWIEFLHWKKLGWRLLWRSLLLNYRIRARRIQAAFARRH